MIAAPRGTRLNTYLELPRNLVDSRIYLYVSLDLGIRYLFL